MQDAQRNGAAFVSVNVARLALGDAMPDSSGRRPPRYEAAMARVRTLYAELGAEAWPDGRWDNALGQVGFYATPQGLSRLRQSAQALAFAPDMPEGMRSMRHHRRFAGLDAALRNNEWVDAVITVRNEQAGYSISAQGNAIVEGGLTAAQKHARRGRAILDAMRPLEVSGLENARAELDAVSAAGRLTSMQFTLRIGRAALRRLVEHPDVATLAQRDAAPRQPPLVDPAALAMAQRDGHVDVLLLMHDPLPHARRSDAEDSRRRHAVHAAMRAIEKQAGASRAWRLMPQVGVMAARLGLADVERMNAAKDQRLTAVVADVVKGEPALDKSTPRMRMGLVWNHDAPAYPNAGFRGAYPSVQGDPSSPHLPVYIVVMDAGTLNTHPMLSGRIADAYSSCFGRFSGVYSSICPGAIAGDPSTWDKKLTPGSAWPPLGSAYCNGRTSNVSFCDHGTLVAGIAGGNSVQHGSTTLSGVAPAAQIVPFQVFSWDLRSIGGPGVFAGEVMTALETVKDASIEGPANNYIVVNLGVGSLDNYFDVPCSSGNAVFSEPAEELLNSEFAAIIDTLRQRGIPVVVPSGNNFQTNKVEWPACLTGTIKVGSLQNPPSSAEFTIFLGANRLHIESTPAWNGDYFFLGSGGGGAPDRLVTSATANTTPIYGATAGTSFAAPHVAGAYAVVRAGYTKLGLNASYSWAGASQYLKQGLTGVDVLGPSIPSDQAPLYRAIRFDAVTP